MNPSADDLQEIVQAFQRPGPLNDELLDRLVALADAHPEDARPLLLLAAEFVQRGDADRAEALYLAALQRAPQLAIARFQLGLLQFTAGRPAVAATTWAALDALPQGDSMRLFKQGLEHLGRNEVGLARQTIQRGIEANQANAPLNDDMRRLIARLADAPRSSAADADTPENPAHVLLAGYQTRH